MLRTMYSNGPLFGVLKMLLFLPAWLIFLHLSLAQYPTLRDIVDPREQIALRDTLSQILGYQYDQPEIGFDDVDDVLSSVNRPPTIAELNKNYSDILFEGDIRLSTENLQEIVEMSQTRKKRKAYRNKLYPSTIWENGVPYAFHKSLSVSSRRSILAAIKFWQRNTCINFRRRTTETVYLLFVGYDQGCWSSVGRSAYQQQQWVSLGRGCELFGITSHEVGHALGLFHEQSRYDRDNWVRVLPRKIPRGLLYNYAKIPPRGMRTYGTPYDIGSVMHYSPFEFSIDPRVPSIVSVNRNEQGAMGQLAGPSFIDVQIMNAHYGCAARCPHGIHCHNGGHQHPRACWKCKCPTGYGGIHCGQIEPPSIHRCSGRLLARATPRRLRLKIKRRPHTKRSRRCIYHIVAPYNHRVLLRLERVGGRCLPGCYKESVELKVRADKRITGNRFCCRLKKPRSILSNSRTVPVILTAGKGKSVIQLQYRFVRRHISHDAVIETLNETQMAFRTSQTIGNTVDEFKLELQKPAMSGEEFDNTDKSEEDESDNTAADSDNSDIREEYETDPELRNISIDDNNVEIDEQYFFGYDNKTFVKL